MVDRYHARVYSLSYGVLHNAEDSEEATQDAFLTLYRKIGTFDESRKFFSWFYRVALNAAYSRARRRRPGITVPIDDFVPRIQGDGQGSPEFAAWVDGIEDETISRELARRAEGFIQELPPAYRDVIWMVDVEEMKPADVAETLEISLAAFKSRLHRARLHVRRRAHRGRLRVQRARRQGEGRRAECGAVTHGAFRGSVRADPRVPRRVRGRLDARVGARPPRVRTSSHCPPCVVFLKSYRATGRTLRMLKPRDIPCNLAEAVMSFVRERCGKGPGGKAVKTDKIKS